MFRNIFKFGWRNLTRNKRRTFFTILAIAVGVLTLVFARSYIKGIINTANEAMIKTEIGHVKIAHKEYLRLKRIMPKEYLVRDLSALRTGLTAMPGIVSMNARIKFHVLLSHGDINEAAVAVGFDPIREDKNMELSKTIVEGNYFENSHLGLELVIGKKLAEKLEVTVNDELLLVTTDVNYSTYALPFKIIGIFDTGFASMDKHLLYIPLPKAQEMLDCGDAAHEILVFLKDPAKSWETCEKIENLLSQKDPNHSIRVMPWQKDDLIELLPTVAGIWDIIVGIIMFIVALVILNTMLMAVMERYHEIGVIKALGFKNREVFAMILVEAFYLGCIGAVIGGILGGTMSALLEKTGIDFNRMTGGMMEKIDIPVPFFGRIIYPDFTLAILIGSMVFGIVVALIAVLYPAFKSSKMLPVEAFRSELKV
ncbi:MAG: ABC transporter permease [Candidatus Aminicenantes bacterium]|jgi:putative ABC transport system permease protein